MKPYKTKPYDLCMPAMLLSSTPKSVPTTT